MWESRNETVPSGFRIRILESGEPLTFHRLFRHLETNEAFADWYTGVLNSVSLPAFFWEHPPLTKQRLAEQAEFVLIESASLARLHPDPEAFADQFARQPGAAVLTFPNLGGDALLVVPRPVDAHEGYPHLAAFLRAAPRPQIRALWKAAARAVNETVESEARWLSTAGLGVSWLHLRLDSRPKYYRFAPYKTNF